MEQFRTYTLPYQMRRQAFGGPPIESEVLKLNS